MIIYHWSCTQQDSRKTRVDCILARWGSILKPIKNRSNPLSLYASQPCSNFSMCDHIWVFFNTSLTCEPSFFNGAGTSFFSHPHVFLWKTEIFCFKLIENCWLWCHEKFFVGLVRNKIRTRRELTGHKPDKAPF